MPDAKVVETVESTCSRFVELIVLALILIGLLMAYSSNAPYAARTGDLGATWHGFYVHSVKVAVAAAFFALALRLPIDSLARHHRKILLGSLVLLGLVLIPGVGSKLNGARRWFQYGPLTFQPVEFAKIAVIITVAACLQGLGSKVRRLSSCGVLLIAVLVPVCALLFLQPDFGSACLISGLVFLLMIFAGARPEHYLPATVVSLLALVLLAWLFMPHVLERLTKHFNPQPGDQAYQSLVALGSGGLLGYGAGLGGGMAKLGYLPMISSDFIFAAIGEEMGFVGTSLVVLLFLMFTVLSVRIVVAQTSMFRFLLGAGITLGIAVQVLINLVVVTAVTPTKGIALPFISAGGSALAMSLFSVGLLINMARNPAAQPRASAVGVPVEPAWGGVRALLSADRGEVDHG